MKVLFYYRLFCDNIYSTACYWILFLIFTLFHVCQLFLYIYVVLIINIKVMFVITEYWYIFEWITNSKHYLTNQQQS